jgi:hypothetical protein
MSHLTFSRIAFLGAVILTPIATLTSQQTNQIQRTLQFENNEVSVWKTLIPPNAPPSMHTHEHPRVLIALTSGTMNTVYENGPTEAHQWESGKAYWLPMEQGKKPHTDANPGSKPIEVIVVELKNAK